MYDYTIDGCSFTVLVDDKVIHAIMFHNTPMEVQRLVLDAVGPDHADEAHEIASAFRANQIRLAGVEYIVDLMLGEATATHPITGMFHALKHVIWSLNDNYDWSREQIADWLDTLPEQPIIKLMEL